MVAPLLFLLGGLGAALIFGTSGCAAPAQPPRAPEPPEDKPPPDPALDIPGGDHASAYWLFRKLKEKGHSPRDMDKGYQRIAYADGVCPKESGLACTVGAGDDKLSAAEIYDFALTASESFDGSMEEITGRPLPWNLDDYNKDTNDDAQYRQQIKDAIGKLDEILAKQGFQKDSPEYRERMAVGLYYLVATPKAEVIQKQRTQFEKTTPELDELKLEEFKEFLFERGGMRLTTVDQGVELNALEALRANKGKSTEHAKLLYAVFRMAKLPAQFVYVNPQKSKNPALQAQVEQNPNLHHFCIALKQGDGVRLFDPAIGSSRPDHPEYRLLSPRNFLAVEAMNRAMLAAEKGDQAVFSGSYQLAKDMDPESPFLALHEGLISFYQGKPDEAIAALDKAITMYPQYSQAIYQRGTLKLAKEDYAGAEKDFTTLIESAPLFSLSYLNRGQTRFLQKNEKGGLADFDELVRLRPDSGRVKRGMYYAQMKDAKKAFEDFDAALQINPRSIEAYGARGMLYGATGDLTKASADFLKLFSLAPSQESMKAALTGLAPVFIRKWSDAKNQDTYQKIGKELGMDPIKAETWFKVSGLMWEAGQKQAAIKALGSFAEEFKKIKAAAAPGTAAPLTQNLLRQMQQSLPRAMQNDAGVKEILKAFA